jgi:xanthine dehydrogenase accessory factor
VYSGDYFERSLKLVRDRVPFVTVTLLSTRGHAPQDPGAKAILTQKGLEWGTVGGGKVEARCIRYGIELLERKGRSAPELVTWNLQRDIGMTCGGEVTYLFEVHSGPKWQVVVFGAGHVAQALVRVLSSLDCHILCIDPREEWTSKMPALPHLEVRCTADPADVIDQLDSHSYFVIMTQGHATDIPILKKLLTRHPDASYLGLIGSDVKALKVRAELKEMGFDPAVIERLHCPIGLQLGTNHPGEIAVSVAAELIQVRDRQSRH